MDETAYDTSQYTEPVFFTIENSSVAWEPGEEFLIPVSGPKAKEITDSVTRFITLASNYGEDIQVTPEGPNLPGTEKNLFTVVWAIETLFSEQEISYKGGKYPTMADLGLDEASDFDKYGNPLVR
jgi:hypothetical protein